MSLFKFQVEIREREKRNLPESNQSQTLVSMADPNHCSSSSSPPTGLTLDSDEISTLINTLLHNSSLPPSSFASPQNSHHHQHQPPTECASAAYDQSAGVNDSSSGLNFSFPSDCYAPGETDRSASPFSGPIASSADGIGDFDCDSEREQLASEAALNSERTRGSSKRSRMAEFHNLSEKKRRQKINEKMKALQKLIPNSNKTDKASLLDDAIDYLKQLQLQVQMLAMRNGSSLHPFYIEGLQTGQPTFAGINYSDEGFPSSSRGLGSLYTTQGISTPVYNPDQYVNSEPKTFMPPTSSHCRPFNFTMSSKEIGHDSNLPQLKLDVNGCGDESSSGVSS